MNALEGPDDGDRFPDHGMIPFPTAVQDTRVQLAKMPREAKIRLWGGPGKGRAASGASQEQEKEPCAGREAMNYPGSDLELGLLPHLGGHDLCCAACSERAGPAQSS